MRRDTRPRAAAAAIGRGLADCPAAAAVAAPRGLMATDGPKGVGLLRLNGWRAAGHRRDGSPAG
jgi:hypothetical protein